MKTSAKSTIHFQRLIFVGFLLKTTGPAVAAWCEMMNGTLPEFNQNNIHVLEDGFPVRQTCDPSATDYCANDGKCLFIVSILYLDHPSLELESGDVCSGSIS